MGTNEHVLAQPAGELLPVALQGGDQGAGAGAVGETRVQTRGIKTEAAIAAGVDLGDEGLIAHLQRNERGVPTIVEGDRRGTGRGRGFRQDQGGRGEQQALTRVIHGQKGLAEKREADETVDGYAEVGGKIGEIEDERRHIGKHRRTQDHAAQRDRFKVDLTAAGRTHLHLGWRQVLSGLQAQSFRQVRRDQGGRGAGVDNEAIGSAVFPGGLDDEEVGDDARRQGGAPSRNKGGRSAGAGNGGAAGEKKQRPGQASEQPAAENRLDGGGLHGAERWADGRMQDWGKSKVEGKVAGAQSLFPFMGKVKRVREPRSSPGRPNQTGRGPVRGAGLMARRAAAAGLKACKAAETGR